VDAGGHYTALTSLSDTRTFSPCASPVCFYFSQQNVNQTPNSADTKLKRSVRNYCTHPLSSEQSLSISALFCQSAILPSKSKVLRMGPSEGARM